MFQNLCNIQSIPLNVNDLDYFMNEKCSEVYVEVHKLEERIRMTRNKASIDLLLEEGTLTSWVPNENSVPYN